MNRKLLKKIWAYVVCFTMIMSMCTNVQAAELGDSPESGVTVESEISVTPNPTEAEQATTPTPEPTETELAVTPTPEPTETELAVTPTPEPTETELAATPTPEPSGIPELAEDQYYIITDADQFDFIRENLTEHYRLGNDIDFSSINFTVIGSVDAPFEGVFDGNGFTMSNVIIQSENDYTGVFGVIYNAAIKNVTINNAIIEGKDYVGALAGFAKGSSKYIENCRIEAGTVKGNNYVGGLIGATDSTSTVSSIIIRNCSVTADVNATGNKAGGVAGSIKGGIVGSNAANAVTGFDYVGGISGHSTGGTIEACYTKGSIEGNNYIGGLVGFMSGGTLEQCYSLKSVNGNNYIGGLLGESNGGIVENSYVISNIQGNSFVGGMIGQCTTITYLTNCYVSALILANDSNVGGLCSKEDNLDISNSFFDISVSELDAQATSSAGKTTMQMRSGATYENWNFSTVWSIEEGQSYPYLNILPKPEQVAGPPIEEELKGTGTIEDPYIITTKKQLLIIYNNLGDYYKLGNSINLGGIEWEPVGTTADPFTGSLDGNGYSISNFTITKSTTNYVGFFGAVNNAVIKNITFDHAVITGKSYVGTVAGIVQGTTWDMEYVAAASGSVTGASYVGGLVGTIAAGSVNPISHCSSDTTIVSTGIRTGGLIGNSYGNIQYSYTAGVISGTSYVGGLTGYSNGQTDITECYSVADITASDNYAGGLTGYRGKGAITNSFVAGSIRGNGIIGGITGAAGAATTITNCYGAAQISAKASTVGGIAGSTSYLTIVDSYYDGTVSGLVSTSTIQVSKTTTALKKQISYVNWDFTTIWSIEEGITYPYLRSLPKPDNVNTGGGGSLQQGTGTLEDPYIINTIADLETIKYELSAYYVLGNNIDLNGTEWAPVGSSAVPFTGGFDGNGYTISNFTINQSTASYVGFFGVISNASIKNLTIKDAYITGKNYVGTFTGSATGADLWIQNCHVEGGSVTGTSYVGGIVGNTTSISTYEIQQCSSNTEIIASGSYVGGIIGYLYGGISSCYTKGNVQGVTSVGGIAGYHTTISNVVNCYSAASVTGTTNVGGIVGYNYSASSIINCYTLGNVSGTSYIGGIAGISNAALTISNSYVAAAVSAVNTTVGGLAGRVTNVTAINSFYDGVVCGITNSNSSGLSRVSDAMKRKATYIGWDFETTWDIEEGVTYPFLRSLPKPEQVTGSTENIFEEGTGTTENPYVIKTKEQLQAVRWELSASYVLANDIDLTAGEWEPLGTTTEPFSGQFDGKGFVISNFSVSRGTVNYIGFFGVISDASVKNLTLSNLKINGKNYVGGLFGEVLGTGNTIDNCHVEDARISGTAYVGGLAGYVAKAGTTAILKCSSNSEVIGTDKYVGNLIGYLYGGIQRCWAEGTVEAVSYVGGLVGYSNAGVIEESYSNVKVTDGTYVGGIAGYKLNGTISNCYAIGSIIGTNYIGGILGSVGGKTYITNCYSTVAIHTTGTSVGGLCTSNSNIVLTASYYDGPVSTIIPNTAYDKSCLTNRLIHKASYEGWDFEAVWTIEEGVTYPYFKELEKPDGVIADISTNLPSGNGTEENPYKIQTAAQLQMIKYEVTADYVLENSIDLNGTEWDIIGKSTNAPFTGSFNGNGCSISNYSISKSTTNYVGFFGIANNACIKNITLENAKVTGLNYVGGLVGYLLGNAWTIENCHIADSRIAGVGYIGGLLGYVVYASPNAMTQSSAEVEVIGSGDRIGGLAGCFEGTITKSYVKGNIQGANYVGGLTGYDETGDIIQSYAVADVVGAVRTAGLVGYKTSGSIVNCYNLGTVTGTNYVGGIVGSVSSTKVYLTNCYTAAVITGTGSYVGGLYGTKGSLVVTSSYYNRTINAGLTVVEENARYTSALKRRANFTDWDFDTIWKINEYKSYPYLIDMEIPTGIEGPVADDLPEGSGTAEDPYIIKNKQQLVSIQYDLTAYYEIVNDIDLSGMEWVPLGTAETPFTGNINGNGFTISNLTINQTTMDYCGLFGVAENALIRNITLNNINIKAGSYVGAFAGLTKGNSTYIKNCKVLSGSISGISYVGGFVGKIEDAIKAVIVKCSSSVTVTATSDYAGGLAGYTTGGISMSYSDSQVTGVNYVGGLVGYGYSITIINTFVLGSVTGAEYVGGIIGISGETTYLYSSYAASKITATGSYAGGIYGSIQNITTTSCYYDGIVSTILPKTATDTSKLTNGMKKAVNFTGWDFSWWCIEEGSSYPYLRDLDKPQGVVNPDGTDSPTGAGTKEDPYVIMTATQLINIRYELNAYFVLGADIDLEGIDWIPLGGVELPFTGSFDGNGYTISNLLIQQTNTSYIGFFGVVKNAVIKNVTITQVTITGGSYVGGLIGLAVGEKVSVYNCNVKTGTVTGISYVGGLIGKLEGEGTATVVNCSTFVQVSVTENYIGGLIGYMDGTISSCYTTGNVTGAYYVGGIAGYASNTTIEISYSAGIITGTYYVGGICGYSWSVLVKECHVLGSISGQEYVAGIIGISESTSYISYCYVACKITATGTFVGGLCSTELFIEVTKSFYDGILTGVNPGLAIDYCKLTGGMMRMSTYEGWDFTSVWAIDEGTSYPYLRPLPIPELIHGIITDGIPEGGGTLEDPYILKTTKELVNIRYELDGYYKLGSSINFQGEQWTTIGTSTKSFTGYFDANGYTIENFVISNQTADYVGFFGVVNSAEIKNLVLKNVHIIGANKVGGIVGAVMGSSTVIEGCDVIDSVIEGDSYVGGIAGYSEGIIKNCSMDGIVSGSNYIGGIVGYNNRGSVKECFSLQDINGVSYAGGIAGYNYTGTIISCESISTITGTYYVGGMAGYSNLGMVADCNSFTSVNGKSYVGGIIGYNNGATIEICSNLAEADGNVLELIKENNETALITNGDSFATVNGRTYVGGIAGYTYGGTASYCSNDGSVTGNIYVGGIIGYCVGTVTEECTNNAAVQGTRYVDNLIGYTKA
ncbi:M26 family metallopeptidase [Anaeromicropila populeti]|uniref:The GLUG motif-containing protein n=1 Tax=Anaeromicropila populeti TaxID=37658 RepID=A0A1I6IEB0_9FIRM|nr:hypothetical protein [Anaeromicropila populeti]SFR65038.1 hypothetical protein SAMN05661086_00757 [Anaeromicropila populeti]